MEHQLEQQPTNSNLFDFSDTPLANDYKGYYFKVLDNVYTPAECAALISLAESNGEWENAAIASPTGDVIEPDFRNSGRILRFDHKTADEIYQRLLPFIQELVEIRPGGKWENIVGTPGRVNTIWKMIGFVAQVEKQKHSLIYWNFGWRLVHFLTASTNG
jgi:hypothetical protein